MPTDLSLPGSSGLRSFKKTRHLPGGIGDVSFDVTAQPGSAVLAALATNGPFPGGRIDLESLSVKVSSDRDVPVGGAKGGVNFSGTASTYQGIAVLDEPADVIALLVRDQINDDLAKGLALEKAGHRYLLLRWGYDLQAAAKGAVGLGAGPKITFGAEGKRLGAYAVVRQIPGDTPSRDAIAALFDSWMLPSQFAQLDDLAPGTTIVAEIDGSLAVKLGVQYGYDFSWIREDVTLGTLAGDIGLKIELGVSASFGFEASGQYALALTRSLKERRLRLQLFRLNRKGLNLAFSAKATAQGSFGGLLPNYGEFLQGVFGLHTVQVLKELETWTDPSRKLTDLIAGVSVDYAREFLSKVTGFDAKAEFNAARGPLVNLLTAWHALPHRVTSVLYAQLQGDFAQLPELRTQLKRVATSDLDTFRPDLEKLLAHVDFFKTPFGKWLESAALTSALNAASDTAEYAKVQEIAKKTLAVLDGSLLEGTLMRLQKELGQRLGLDKIERIVDQATFDNADEWLKARLSAFLGKTVDFEQVQKIRVAINRLLKLQEKFFEQARTALTRKYEFQMLATYQKATTKTALLDVVFDYDAADAADLDPLVVSAIDGNFDQIFLRSMPGVLLRQAVLTHEIKRQTHLELSMPFATVEMDHVNTSLAQAEAIDAERGRIVVYDLHAEDLKAAKGKFSSRLTVHGRFVQGGAARVFDEQSMTHSYTFRQAVPKMRRRVLEAQLGAYADTYFSGTFGTGEASFSTWVSDLDRTVDRVLNNGPDNFGNTLMSLEVTAPSRLVGAWALAPQSAKAPEYSALSKIIQGQLRRLIPLSYFQDLSKLKDRVPSAALLVYSSLPPATGITVKSGQIVRFDGTSDVYPDIDTSGNLEALARSGSTVAALTGRLTRIHDVLEQSDGMADEARHYDPAREGAVNRIVNDALGTANGLADLQALLVVERQIIRKAHTAGPKIAAFLAAKKPAEALKHLSAFGADVTDAFNSSIGGLFNGRELRQFGTLVFLEAARAFDPGLPSLRPSAILQLTVVKDAPSFPLGSFVDGADIPAADIVNAQKFVSLAPVTA